MKVTFKEELFMAGNFSLKKFSDIDLNDPSSIL